MKTIGQTPFETFLNEHDEEAWLATVTILLRSIHEVDKSATQIWFAFYPLTLFKALEAANDPEQLARQLLLQGQYYLRDQIDSSHTFLYGHRYWPQVKRAIADHADQWHRLQPVTTQPTQTDQWHRLQPVTTQPTQTEVCATSLADQILDVANKVAKKLKIDASLVVGITAVGFMTVQQAGLDAFNATTGEILLDSKHAKKSAEQVLKERAKDDSQGFLGFLRTVDKKWTVTYDENDDAARYKLNHAQDLAWGAADDRSRNWREIDPRRIEGPIPVECRSASCGTCWVGVLGGAEKLSDVAVREGKQIKRFGYIDTNESKPLIRLACQAQAQGAVSIVIPPWNGVFGKYLEENSRNDTKESTESY